MYVVGLLEMMYTLLEYCNFIIYSICIDCIPPLRDEFGHVRVIERINVNL